MRFKDKVAIITGAGHGIGKAIAQRLAKEGAQVMALDINKAGVEETAETIRKDGGVVLELAVDITKIDEVKAIVAKTLVDFGEIDILINCAGGGFQQGIEFKDMAIGSWQWVFDLNVNGTLNFTHSVIPHMIERKYGKIVNFSSIASKVGLAKWSIYSATKGAIDAFTKASAMELGPYNINVNMAKIWKIGIVKDTSVPMLGLHGTSCGLPWSPGEDSGADRPCRRRRNYFWNLTVSTSGISCAQLKRTDSQSPIYITPVSRWR